MQSTRLRIWRLGFESLAARQTPSSEPIKQKKLDGRFCSVSP